MKPKLYNYGNYSNDNYGSSIALQIGDLTLYFSYQTIVAYRVSSTGEFEISNNKWGSTTGRHLNCINQDKSIRVVEVEFVDKLRNVLGKYNLNNHNKEVVNL